MTIQVKQTDIYQKWVRKLRDTKAKTIVTARINRLVNGLAGDVASIGDGVSELRIHYGSGYRVYFIQRGQKFILLLCGGDKSSQRKDIELAKSLAKEWSDKYENLRL